MRPSFEKLIPPADASIRCFRRTRLKRPLWHYHPEIEIKMVESGAGFRFVGDSVEPYQSGDLVLLGPNLPHHWSSDQYRRKQIDCEHVVIVQFLPIILGERLLACPELSAIEGLLTRSSRGLELCGGTRERVAKLLRRMLAQSPFDRILSLLQVLQLMATADDFRPLASEGYSPAFRHKLRTRISLVCHYISDHIGDVDLNQADIARYAKMTPAAFCRFFKATTQRTVTQYVNELRIAHASRLLVESELSVLDISLQAGFRTPSHFHRQFRDQKKMSPLEYRRRHAVEASSFLSDA